MKILLNVFASVLCFQSVNAQFFENFDQDLAGLAGKCWSYNNVNYTTTSQDVINGTGSVYTTPPPAHRGSVQ